MLISVTFTYNYLMLISLQIIKEFLRLEPQADEPDPRVAVLKGLEKYRLPIIAILRKRKAVPLYMETLLELYDHDESQCE